MSVMQQRPTPGQKALTTGCFGDGGGQGALFSDGDSMATAWPGRSWVPWLMSLVPEQWSLAPPPAGRQVERSWLLLHAGSLG